MKYIKLFENYNVETQITKVICKEDYWIHAADGGPSAIAFKEGEEKLMRIEEVTHPILDSYTSYVIYPIDCKEFNWKTGFKMSKEGFEKYFVIKN